MAETDSSEIHTRYNPALDMVNLQCSVDEHMATQLGKHVDQERGVHDRMNAMQTLISDLHSHRKKLEEDPDAVHDNPMLEAHIQRFCNEHWPALMGLHEGILVDSNHPFPGALENTPYLGSLKTPDDVADSIDKLRELIEQEQYTLSHITRDLTALTQKVDAITTMHSRRRPDESVRQMVRNQQVR